jgi:hypothetical protein
MQIFKDKFELPLWNWLMIIENSMDFKYLLKKRPIFKPNQKKLREKYMEIMGTLKNINSDVLEKYVHWMTLFTMHRALKNKQKLNKLIDKNLDVVVNDLEKVFRAYLETLEEIYKDFEYTEYYFNPEWRDEYIKLFGLESYRKYSKELQNFEPIKFYVWDEYAFFIKRFPMILPLTMHDNFKGIFIQQRKVKLPSLIELDNYLNDIYSAHGLYDEYQMVRLAMFDVNRLNAESKSQADPFLEVSMVGEILGFQIDTKKTTLAEYEKMQLRTTQKAKRMQDEPKPMADGRL